MLTESDIGGFSRTQKEEQQKKDAEADITVALKKTKTAKKQTGKQPETARTKPKQPTKRRKKKS